MILSELKRRNVLREVGAYAVIAWLLMQIADVMLEPLELPAWVMSAIVYTLIVGFFAVSIFAWRYDITARGIIRTPPRDSNSQPLPLHRGDYVLFLVLSFLVVVGAYGVVTELKEGNLAEVQFAEVNLPANGVAVLPFLNLSNDPGNEYFSDGLADTVLHMLAQIDQLKVTARTSSFAFKGKNEDIRAIGRKLNVRNVLEGSVQFAGNRVRVIAQLINANDGSHIWSRTFDRQTADVFSIQDDIAAEVANALKVTLGGEGAQRPRHGTTNIEAYRAYLLGVEALNSRNSERMLEAIEHLKKAIEVDPDYVEGYVGLADLYITLYRSSIWQMKDAFEAAKPMAEKAIELGPDLAEANATWAYYRGWSGNIEEMEYHHKRAMELNPNLVKTYKWYSFALRHHLGRVEEALPLMRKAVSLDPLEPDVVEELGSVFEELGRTDEAAEQYLKVIEIDPEYARGYLHFGYNRWGAGELDKAGRLIRKALELDPGIIDTYGDLGNVYLSLGDIDTAQQLAEGALAIDSENWYANFQQLNVHMHRKDFVAAEAIIDQWFKTITWWPTRAVASWVYEEQGRFEDALEQLNYVKEIATGAGDRGLTKRNLGTAISYAFLLQKTGGAQEEIDEILKRALLYAQSQPPNMTWQSEASIYCIKGKTEAAIAALRRAIDDGQMFDLSTQAGSPADIYAPIRKDPRFIEMEQQVKAELERMRKSLEERPELDESDLRLPAA